MKTSGPNTSQNRKTRLEQKDARLPSGAVSQTPPLQKPAPVATVPAKPAVSASPPETFELQPPLN